MERQRNGKDAMTELLERYGYNIPILLTCATIMDKRDKYALLGLFKDLKQRGARFNPQALSLSPHPTYNVENMYPQFFLTFNIVFRGAGLVHW